MVDDVEPLAVEDLRHEVLETRRQGDPADAAVVGHRDRLADLDDVLGGRVVPPRRGDDPDLVAAVSKVLVGLADVVVRAAWPRVRVGTHDPDLHAGRFVRPTRRLARLYGSRIIERHCCVATPSRCSRSVQARPFATVVRAWIAARSASASAPGNSVQAVPTSFAWCASLEPVSATRRTCWLRCRARSPRTRPA